MKSRAFRHIGSYGSLYDSLTRNGWIYFWHYDMPYTLVTSENNSFNVLSRHLENEQVNKV